MKRNRMVGERNKEPPFSCVAVVLLVGKEMSLYLALPASSLIFHHKASIDSAIAYTRPLFRRVWLLVPKAN